MKTLNDIFTETAQRMILERGHLEAAKFCESQRDKSAPGTFCFAFDSGVLKEIRRLMEHGWA